MTWSVRASRFAAALSLLLLASFSIGQSRQSAAAPRQASLSGKILSGYVGRYQLLPTLVLTVALDGDHLSVLPTAQNAIEIFPESATEFFSKTPGMGVTFKVDDRGQATQLVWHQGGSDTVAPRIASPTAASLAPRFAEIDTMVGDVFAERSLGSVTIGVVVGSDLVWTKNYGLADMERKIPAGNDTVYRIGSITKMLTALMLQQLVNNGKVHYSDSVEKYFPEINQVQGRLAGTAPVTLIELATHTAGIGLEPDNTDTYTTGPAANWEKTLIAALPHTHFEFEPGTHYAYSNIGYAILGAALSRAAGQPYLEYVPAHIFVPLGMSHSSLVINPAILAHLSKGYLLNGDKIDSETPHRELEGRGYKMPNGTAFTTVGDLARFASFLLGHGDDAALPAGILEHNQSHILVATDADMGNGYGLGATILRRATYTAYGHAGSVAGYTAALYLNRGLDIGVVALSNADGTRANPDGIALRALDILSR